MKKVFLGIIVAVVVCCTISIVINQNSATDNEVSEEHQQTQITSSTQNNSSEEDDTAKIKISSDEYFDLVNDTIKKQIEPAGYTISGVSKLRSPYYHIECMALDIDTSNFKTDTLEIAENIYNVLIEYEYKRPNIFIPSYEIISLTFNVVVDDETTNSICIQFDLTDIDKTKSFLENLKTPVTP